MRRISQLIRRSYGPKTIFSFERNIYHPEYAIFQGGLIRVKPLFRFPCEHLPGSRKNQWARLKRQSFCMTRSIFWVFRDRSKAA